MSYRILNFLECVKREYPNNDRTLVYYRNRLNSGVWPIWLCRYIDRYIDRFGCSIQLTDFVDRTIHTAGWSCFFDFATHHHIWPSKILECSSRAEYTTEDTENGDTIYTFDRKNSYLGYKIRETSLCIDRHKLWDSGHNFWYTRSGGWNRLEKSFRQHYQLIADASQGLHSFINQYRCILAYIAWTRANIKDDLKLSGIVLIGNKPNFDKECRPLNIMAYL